MVELLVTIAIAGILVAAVVPQFQSMVRRSQLTSVTNDMIMAINFARSEAARVGGGVRMRTMDATDAANEWGPGWQVIGKDGVTVLQTFAGAAGGMKLNGTNGVVQVTFNSRGLPDRTMTVAGSHQQTRHEQYRPASEQQTRPERNR